MKQVFGFTLLACLWTTARLEPAEYNWPHWRGPENNGHSLEKGLPFQWDAKSVVWKTPIEGRGQSSPIIWGDRIFLTTALGDGAQRVVLCVDRKNGKILWQHVAWKGTPEPTHQMNGWATPTCTTDGEHVFACFGKGGMHCYTVDGKHVWSQELGTFLSKTKRGTAASPVLAGDLVIWNGDSESDPFLFGLDKKTGKIVWKVNRSGREGYSTPLVIDVNGHQELILNGDPNLAGYDPATGKQLWMCKNFAPRGEPTPAFNNGLLYVINGQPGDLYALRPGGSGDVTQSHMVWHSPRKSGRDQPSPLVIGDYLLVANMEGILVAYNTTTGKELWKDRISTKRISGSPVAVEGRAFFLNEAGQTIVVEPGPELKIVATNTVGSSNDEIFRATPTPCQGQFFIRSDQVLYCIGSAK